MWLITQYQAVTLFTLKLSSATASGGKTLLVPTPYAIKMAMLDACCRIQGAARAEQEWPRIRDLPVALRPPDRVAVSNLFQKVLRPRRAAAVPGDPEAGPFQRTIGYREYAHLDGNLGIALQVDEPDRRNLLAGLLLNINYLGKRGSFFQLVLPSQTADSLPEGFVVATETPSAFALNGTLQILDDCGAGLTFAKANVFSDEKVRMGKERITRNVVLPGLRLTRSSKSFSLYERTES